MAVMPAWYSCDVIVQFDSPAMDGHRMSNLRHIRGTDETFRPVRMP
jgi:hypothetical protein